MHDMLISANTPEWAEQEVSTSGIYGLYFWGRDARIG